MICKLCLRDKSLIKRSHIIPNFMYKSMLEISRKLVSVKIDDVESDRGYMQSGYNEPDLLCADCDNGILGGLERYASNHIYTAPSGRSRVIHKEYPENHEIIPYVRYSNLDYHKTKLFLLSILWRCHHARGRAFTDVDLGPHAEVIRRMILTNDAGPDDEYEVIIMSVDTEGTRPSKSVIDPRRIHSGGNTFYLFHINEMMYHFNISKHNKQTLFTKGAVRKDNVMDIALLKGKWARDHFDLYLGKTILMKSNVRR